MYINNWSILQQKGLTKGFCFTLSCVTKMTTFATLNNSG